MFGQGEKPCPECHLWICKCVEVEVPDPADREPAPATLRDAVFVTKTRAELARLVAELKPKWRARPAHPMCDDRYVCSHCGPIRDHHRLINDHLDQLDIAAVEAYEAEFEASA